MSPPHQARLAAFPRRPVGTADDAFALARRLEAPIWVFDIDASEIVYANNAACHFWQAEDEAALCARDMASGMSSTVAKRLRQYQVDFLARDARFNEMWTLYPNGQPTSVTVVFAGFRLPDGRMAMQCEVLGGAGDEPENLRSAEALLHTDVMISLFDCDGPPLYLNPAARNATSNASQTLSDMFLDPGEYVALTAGLEDGNEHRTVAEVRTSDGIRWYDITAKTCSDAVTGNPAILVTASDVSELKTARDTARFLADRDPLTGCYNRTYLQSHITGLSTRLPQGNCALFYFDVDRFKQINDQFGHEMGDVVLRAIAGRAQAVVRPVDVISRLGGDEFVILFEDIQSPEQFALESDRFLRAFSKPVVHGNLRINVTISAGIAFFSPGEVEYTTVLREADLALYAAKQGGRNRAIIFDPEMGIAARERDEIGMALQDAVTRREFILHYQPRVDLQTGQVVSAEGLVRWLHPQRGLVMPDTFIPLCEETGQIEELGKNVLDMGCAQAIAWNKAGRDIEVSINISPRQFNDDRMMTVLRGFSQAPGFPAGKVELEITESVLIGDHDLIAQKLTAITDMGYRIAIDDFGTGYSNLSYISRFPLECLKIDRSFVAQLPGSGPIIKLILTLGREIGATIVAEGVETKEQFDWLKDHGCDQAQGYYLARPMPIGQLGAAIDRLNAAG